MAWNDGYNAGRIACKKHTEKTIAGTSWHDHLDAAFPQAVKKFRCYKTIKTASRIKHPHYQVVMLYSHNGKGLSGKKNLDEYVSRLPTFHPPTSFSRSPPTTPSTRRMWRTITLWTPSRQSTSHTWYPDVTICR